MKRRFPWVAAAALSCALLSGVASAAADSSAHEAARTALREGQYARVLDVTRQIAQAEPGSALNWYRMAIAAARSGDGALAAEALARAEKLDPSLSFASSPERVRALRETIKPLLENPGGQIPVAAAGAGAELDPMAVTAVGALGERIAQMTQALDSRLAAVTKEVAAARQENVQARQRSDTERAVWIVGFLMAVVVCAFGVALALERAARARRQGDLRDLARLPLPQLIAATRDAHALLVARLELHGHQGSELYLQANKVLPSLEREAGRTQVSLSALAAGRPLQDVSHGMLPQPKVLGRVSGDALHEEVLRARLGTTPAPARDAAHTVQASGSLASEKKRWFG